MSTLLNIWKENKKFFELKNVKQIISICGNGELRDNGVTSMEFRELLKNISSDYLIKYADECLSESFPNSGFLLQDIMNQIGVRLGYKVENGLYRGTKRKETIGFDGMWIAKDGHQIVVEVKTTDAYRINLDTIADYRNRLIEDKKISTKSSSILIIVGRQDTGDLEAQIRGSRHAWDVRLISADSLLKLMILKENINDTKTSQQINEILKPLEYTKVDPLIDIIFNTTEDLQIENTLPENIEEEKSLQLDDRQDIDKIALNTLTPKTATAQFHELCIEKVSKHLNTNLVKLGRCLYNGANDDYHLVCIVSKKYIRKNSTRYWYAFHPAQQDFLLENKNSYLAFGCGSENKVIFIPYEEFEKTLNFLGKTVKSEDKFYWHVEIFQNDNEFTIRQNKKEDLNITKYLI